MTLRRKLIVEEILQTEDSYLKTLQDIQRLFVQPLSQIIQKRQLQEIFSNINDIRQVNTELYSQLCSKLPLPEDGGCVGDVFLFLSPFLKIYSVFVKNYQNSMQVVMELQGRNQQFAQFLASKSSECRGLSFQGFILAPVQRIPRYKLLLDDLLKHTPSTHADFDNLTKALASIEQVATYVNEMIREHECVMKMLALQKNMSSLPEDLIVPGRKFLKQGVVTKICRKSNKTRGLFLFTDVLIYASLSSRKSDQTIGLSQSISVNIQSSQFVFHKMLRLDGMNVVNIEDTDTLKNCFQIQTAEKSFAVLCATLQEKSSWISSICKAVSSFQLNKSTLKVEEVLEILDEEEEDENLAPIWIPDNAVIACMQCDALFSMVKRRHHCRSCGRVLCSTCSGKKSVLPKFYNTETAKRNSMATFNSSHIVPSVKTVQNVRVCSPCYELIEGKMYYLTSKLSDKRSVQEMQRPSQGATGAIPLGMISYVSDSEDDLISRPPSAPHNIVRPKLKVCTNVSSSVPHRGVQPSNDYNITRSFQGTSTSTISQSNVDMTPPIKRQTPSIVGNTMLMRQNSLRIRSRSVTSLTLMTNQHTTERFVARRFSFSSQFETSSSLATQLKRKSKAFFQSPMKGRLIQELSEKIKPRYISVKTPDVRDSGVFFQQEDSKIVKAGFLSKCGKTWKTWKARWMVLTSEELSWFVPDQSVIKELCQGALKSRLDIKGSKFWMNSLKLDQCTEVSYAAIHEFAAPFKYKWTNADQKDDFVQDGANEMFAFKLVTVERTLYMIAVSKKHRDEWIDALTAAIGDSKNILLRPPDDRLMPAVPSRAPSFVVE